MPQIGVVVPAWSWVHVRGAHPHTFGSIAPHTSGAAHAPQFSDPPHPSGSVPQFTPCPTQE